MICFTYQEREYEDSGKKTAQQKAASTIAWFENVDGVWKVTGCECKAHKIQSRILRRDLEADRHAGIIESPIIPQ